jgi:hypothetical protein
MIGTSRKSIPWTSRAYHDVVKACGGERLSAWYSAGRIVVTGISSDGDVELAKCVQASTAVRMWVNVRGQSVRTVDQHAA